MEYYTTEEQERGLHEKYMDAVREVQDKIHGGMYSRVQRNREYNYIPQPDRIFYVENGKVYLSMIGEKYECPNRYVLGGKCYIVDYSFMVDIQKFVEKHKNYMIIFSISSRYGPTKEYHAGHGVYPARIVADNEELVLEDEEKYISQVL
jgi:hypothetical protein